MRILFFGTADISVVFLKCLFERGFDILALTQIDKPAKRGSKVLHTPVKSFCLQNNIEFASVEKWDEHIKQKVFDWGADAGLAVSFGKIIPDYIFQAPHFKTLNIHFSLLPKYRGAAPVQYALLNGDRLTGVTSFFIEKTLDTGKILLQKSLEILPCDDA
ncbi:MAG: methionyl-tRNA formyltransferase, partial [Elusimicrobiota bacterium]|nr:methionyl-tRNA formyltransferase [Elusimicrobiota bacterium]